MKTKLFLALFTLIGFTMLVSCGTKKEAVPNLTNNTINAQTLWERITKTDNYKKYKFWPGHEGMQRGQSPHGIFHIAYINSILKNALPISNRIAPDGSIIVKENFNSSKELKLITIMAKVKGYDPENGDWFWGKYSPDGKVLMAGKLAKCAECHKASYDIDNDFVVLHRLDQK